jgi:hypothetical protein
MEFTKGTRTLIEKARAESIEFYGMDGDGMQAPGAIVIREVGGYHPFAVYFANTQCGGYCHGDYCETLDEAQEAFVAKCNRYDPTAALNGSFNAK